ncbi:MAG: GNAT family N-acetyltransferase [Cyclobacteriaceae bacterium]
MERIVQHKKKDYKLFVLEMEDSVIAFIALHWYHAFHHTKPVGRVVAFCVDERFRGQGYGSQLLENAEGFFRQKDCFKIELTSNLRRKDSHEYYFRKGYRQASMHLIKEL